MRPGEVAKLRWCDIDSNGPTVNGVPTWIYTVHAAKTAHHDHVTRYALPPAAQAILGEFPAVPTAHIFSPAGSMAERRQRLREARQSPPTRQMRDRDARPKPVYAPRWGVHEYRVAVERACRVAGVDRFTPHEVRHAFASWAANALGVMVASVALNHKNLATTQRYLHADPAAAFLAAAEVQKRVGG
jgi:integrase